jgi:hypothetical protein
MQTDDANCLVKPALLLFGLASHSGVFLELVRMELGGQKAVGSFRLFESCTFRKQQDLESLSDGELRLLQLSTPYLGQTGYL